MSERNRDASMLLRVANPELYRQNAFRLTGLPVTATARQIAKQADKIKMLADLGGHAAQQFTVIEGELPPSIDEVRGAMQRLKDVENRAIDEFFWFWPRDWAEPDGDEAFEALKLYDLDTANAIWHSRWNQNEDVVACHNIAVLYHMRALEWSSIDLVNEQEIADKESERTMWTYAADLWQRAGEDDALWEAFKIRIRQVQDAALTTGFARRLRSGLSQALARINAELAISYASNNRMSDARWHMSLFKKYSNDDQAANVDSLLAPTHQKLSRAIQSAQNRTSSNQTTGINEGATLLEVAKTPLSIIELFYGSENLERIHLFDEVADAALSLAIAGYNAALEKLKDSPPPSSFALDPKAQAADWFIAVLQSARPLVTDIELRAKIDENLAIARGNHRFVTKIRPIFSELALIQKDKTIAPRMRLTRLKTQVLPKVVAIIQANEFSEEEKAEVSNTVAMTLRSIGIEAHNDHNDAPCAMEATELALRYVLDRELRQRLNGDSLTLKSNMAASTPSNGIPRPATTAVNRKSSNSGCAWVIVVGFVIAALVLSNQKSASPTKNYSPSYSSSTGSFPKASSPAWQPATKPPPFTPKSTTTPPLFYNPPQPSVYSPSPSVSKTREPTDFYKTSNGQTYNVPHSDFLRLSSQKATLDARQNALNAKERSLNLLQAQNSLLASNIDNARRFLDNTNQYAVDSFNAQVNAYNIKVQQEKAAVTEYNRLINELNAQVDAFNAELARVGTRAY